MSKDIESLIEQKKNTFDHILYEFEMYIATFDYFKKPIDLKNQFLAKQFWINVLLESHALHLRNLIHFFSGKDSINVNTVFKDKPRLGIHYADEKAKLIDQTICHLTVERVDPAMDESNITKKFAQMINDMYPEICERIYKYLELLSDDCLIQDKYALEFKEPMIQKRYQHLIELIKKLQ